jgi:hypothetical protein
MGHPEGWADAPLVFVVRQRCPHCRSTLRPIIVRSEQNGDGSTTRKSVCRACSGRFKLVVETLPDLGNDPRAAFYDDADG